MVSVDSREEPVALDTRTLWDEPRDAAAAGARPDVATPQVGDLLAEHLRIQGVLGSGGMGTVYLAWDERLERPVAIKLLHAECVANAAMRESFAAEARAMARVQHPNVVTVHESGEIDGCPYLVMEYIRGDHLAQWHRRRGTLAPSRALAVISAICHGVQAIHQTGAVHRDLKPSNVLVGPGERIAVSDFGLARPLGQLTSEVEGYITGTPAYLAPELTDGQPLLRDLAKRADVYALGVIAYELLTGQRPFTADTTRALLALHASAEPTPPSQVRPGLPKTLDDVILHALEKSPATRTESAAAFDRDLQAAWAAASGPREPRCILLVDDDISTLQGLRAVLGMEWPGAEIITVADPIAARDLARRHQPDVIVTDLHMPNGGGVALTTALRADPQTHALPIIVVTGVGGAGDWHHLQRLGANRFLVKPVDIDALIAMIRAILGAG